MMKAVRFVMPHRLYNAGEVASFSTEQADAMIEAGIATAHEDVPAKKKAGPSSVN